MLPTPIAVAACDSICHWAAGSRLRGRTFFYLRLDRKSTRLNSSHLGISYAVFCLKKKTSSTLYFDSLTDNAGNGGFLHCIQMDTSVNAAHQVVSVGAALAFDADHTFCACL